MVHLIQQVEGIMFKSSFSRLATMSMAAIVLSACQSSGLDTLSNLSPNAQNSPAAGIWQLSQGSIDQRPLNTALASITLQTGNGEFSGNSGVNQYRVKVQQQGAQLAVEEQIQITRMAGSIEEMRLESDYLSALRRVKQSSQQADSLLLSGDGVELIFKPSY